MIYLPRYAHHRDPLSLFSFLTKICFRSSILLSVPRNPVTALGLPLALGMLSGYPDHRTAAGPWYKVTRLVTAFDQS